MLAHALLFCLLVLRASAQDKSSTSTASAETTMNLFLGPNARPTDAFVGSIVNADACATTYGFGCTSGFGDEDCRPSASVRALHHHLRLSFRAFCKSNKKPSFMQSTTAPANIRIQAMAVKPGAYIPRLYKSVVLMARQLPFAPSSGPLRSTAKHHP